MLHWSERYVITEPITHKMISLVVIVPFYLNKRHPLPDKICCFMWPALLIRNFFKDTKTADSRKSFSLREDPLFFISNTVSILFYNTHAADALYRLELIKRLLGGSTLQVDQCVGVFALALVGHVGDVQPLGA